MILDPTKLSIRHTRKMTIRTNIFDGVEITYDSMADPDKYSIAKLILVLWRKRTITRGNKIEKTFDKLSRLANNEKTKDLFSDGGKLFITKEYNAYKSANPTSIVDDVLDSRIAELHKELHSSKDTISTVVDTTTWSAPITISPGTLIYNSIDDTMSVCEPWVGVGPYMTGIYPGDIDPSTGPIPVTIKDMDDKVIESHPDNVAPPVNDIKSAAKEAISTTIKKNKITQVVQKIMDFFSEFDFEPNFRFINTLARLDSNKAMREYISNYFALIDNPSKSSIEEKMTSIEFQEITEQLENMEIKNKINDRFKLYYGSQGTGKTTKAMEESNGACMVCHSAMLPSDLMEDFKFEDGKANFVPSALQEAMVNGTIITLDEINLLPFESLRFLQSVLDGKKEFIYKGQTISIKDGFKVIGTMNLKVNGSIFSLPEPLVDRAEALKEFKLTANDLADALL